MLKKILLGFCVLLIAIQFVRPQKNLSTSVSPNDITVKYPTSPEVKKLLQVACYDCHSNNTRYPWYAEVQPVAWWLADHIKEGKQHLNFSEFGALTPKRGARKMQQMMDELADHSMPLPSYRWGHKDARLAEAQVQLLTDWADSIRDKLAPDDEKSDKK